MKILILGHARHGKDTVAEMLQEMYGLTFSSSSRAALDAIYPVLSLTYPEWSKEEMFTNRMHCRELWKRLISLYNAADKSALCRKILETSDIYVGMRCDQEYEACKELFDLVLWIDASKRHPEKDSTMLIKHTIGEMLFIDNNGTLDDLRDDIKFAIEVMKREA